MESISGEIFTILKYLLPGFVCSWIFHAFTSYPKQAQFERVIQALIFTVFIQACVYLIKPVMIYLGKFKSFGIWDSNSHLIWAYIFAVIVGVIFSVFANNDLFHRFLRFCKITSETSFHCEWFGTFKLNQNYVILHLADDTQVFGWPIEWPSDPSKGHIVLSNPCWVEDHAYVDMPTVKLMMFNVSQVKWVQFLQETPGVEYVEESTNTTSVSTDQPNTN
ncbi:TPA: DUF6338 family protein [Yersinia enterocolitica]|uniref:DUF6338 family protein n=2 Tax=Yersiniaceae TaxID=1903411 RepID=UPI001CFEAEBB|nr:MULTISPECIES: DUF6338 family protein [Yersinia]HDV7149705.1 hypothetical protein [Yersinia enterocolitica]MCB5299277.1 DUF6338 family protein [Yersinia intermedia]MDA5543356.1 DUF6338 family protein [Yersinia rochesterensis]UZM73590.1 DUF6338 family protein [Yersinia sp. SCPM-O-B-9106 (C-191)]HDV7159093.1 hypothetical protein [Yersinia enterocolitica]